MLTQTDSPFVGEHVAGDYLRMHVLMTTGANLVQAVVYK